MAAAAEDVAGAEAEAGAAAAEAVTGAAWGRGCFSSEFSCCCEGAGAEARDVAAGAMAACS